MPALLLLFFGAAGGYRSPPPFLKVWSSLQSSSQSQHSSGETLGQNSGFKKQQAQQLVHYETCSPAHLTVGERRPPAVLPELLLQRLSQLTQQEAVVQAIHEAISGDFQTCVHQRKSRKRSFNATLTR